MAEYRYLTHTSAEIDQAIEEERAHCANADTHTSPEEKAVWNGAAAAVTALRDDTFGVPAGRVTSGSNMDTYTTEGAFLCLSSAVGKTLINCPVEAGFRLEVKALAAGVGRVVQTLYPNINSDVLFYTRRLISTGWTSWYAVTGVEVPVINTAAEGGAA